MGRDCTELCVGHHGQSKGRRDPSPRRVLFNAVSNILAGNLGQHPVYLWTLPMFHCNGWCFPWTIAASAGINVCLRKVDPAKISELIPKHGVTHMCGAPMVYNTLNDEPGAPKGKAARPVVGLIPVPRRRLPCWKAPKASASS